MSNLVLSWLAGRLERLYEIDGTAVAGEVHDHMKTIFANAKETYDKLESNGTLAGDLAAASTSLQVSLRQFTGLSSAAGRIARMETEHMLEGLRHFSALLDPSAFEVGVGPSVVPIANQRVIVDDSKVLTNNASRATSDLTQPSASPAYKAPVFTPTGPEGAGLIEPAKLEPTMQPMAPETAPAPGQKTVLSDPAPTVAGTPPALVPVEEPPLATEPEADNHTEPEADNHTEPEADNHTDIPPPDRDKSGVHEQSKTPPPDRDKSGVHKQPETLTPDRDKSGVHEQPETLTPEEPVPHVEA
jgi:hypothetical protein